MTWKKYAEHINMHEYVPDIVVIEEEHILHKLYADVLSLIGLAVSHGFKTSSEFIEKYQFDEPRIIIQHHTLLGVNGFELLRYIKEKDPISYVIVLTAAHHTKDQYMKIGADSWIEKPCRMNVLFENVIQGCKTINERI